MEPTLFRYAKDQYSQNGEDGIIEEIVGRLDLEPRWFCEFGAWDGKRMSNCHRLLKNGWTGVMIEADEERYEELAETGSNFEDRLTTIQSMVRPRGEHSLNAILEETAIPTEFGLLSIDVDGEDYFIWDSLVEYRPLIVVIEYNPQFGTDIRFASDLIPGGYIRPGTSSRLQKTGNNALRAAGSSFRAMVELGERKGYTSVAATEINLVFVRDDLVDELELPEEELDSPETLFKPAWRTLEWWRPDAPIYRRHPIENVARLRERYRSGGMRGAVTAIVRSIKRDIP